MKEIEADKITEVVKELCIESNIRLGEDILDALKRAIESEDSPLGREILEDIVRNAEVAFGEKVPLCQDTGFVVVFLELGQEARIVGGDLYQAINDGVRRAWKESYFRPSIIKDPFGAKNTGDNTPAVIHIEILPGDGVKIMVAPKGSGSENMSKLRILRPADGIEGIKDFVVETVARAGPNPCPPLIVGVGIGGDLEKVAWLAKKASLRPIGKSNPDERIAQLERELLGKINDLGIGPQGLGGRTTALAVHIETFPYHIASLPVAVNINCHATRHKEAVL